MPRIHSHVHPGPGPRPARSELSTMASAVPWWTRTQRIRTAAAAPFEVALVEISELPAYQKIARKALHLRELALSDRAIAVRLGVTDKIHVGGPSRRPAAISVGVAADLPFFPSNPLLLITARSGTAGTSTIASPAPGRLTTSSAAGSGSGTGRARGGCWGLIRRRLSSRSAHSRATPPGGPSAAPNSRLGICARSEYGSYVNALPGGPWRGEPQGWIPR